MHPLVALLYHQQSEPVAAAGWKRVCVFRISHCRVGVATEMSDDVVPIRRS